MIQRYLGNKNSIADYILREVGRFCQPRDIVCDIFSGTISMSMALKRSGYRVISNDISIFSYHYANCYLRNNTIYDICPKTHISVLHYILELFTENNNNVADITKKLQEKFIGLT